LQHEDPMHIAHAQFSYVSLTNKLCIQQQVLHRRGPGGQPGGQTAEAQLAKTYKRWSWHQRKQRSAFDRHKWCQSVDPVRPQQCEMDLGQGQGQDKATNLKLIQNTVPWVPKTESLGYLYCFHRFSTGQKQRFIYILYIYIYIFVY